MGLFDQITSLLGGGVIKEVGDIVKSYFPPTATEQEKAAFQLALADQMHKREIELMRLAAEADAEFNRRIIEMEGTAADLKALPIIGPILLFMRGAQRPVWGFATLWLDWQTFAGAWTLTSQQESILMAINVLVLGFLFGERAVKNIAPLLERFVSPK